MPFTIWEHASRHCTVSVSGAAIAVRLFDGEFIVDERAVNSSEQALSVAEAWKAHPRPPALNTSRRRKPATPWPTSHKRDGLTAVPRVMWIDRR
jgi:hypothetical protein